MIEQPQRVTTFVENSSSYTSYPPFIIMQCEQLLSIYGNKSTSTKDQHSLPNYAVQLLAKTNFTLNANKSMADCVTDLMRLVNNATEMHITRKTDPDVYNIPKYSYALLTFVFLIGFVSLISMIGNLILAKVLYSKRFRLIQTDRIVLCLALSELCLVIIDTPPEIYRFLSSSYTQEWLCQFHTFFESLFSSCIIFYHLLGAFDRFVYIHGHTASSSSSWSKWCRHASTKSGSIILLVLPIICSLPLAICNYLHAHIVVQSATNQVCMVQYTHEILISLLISFYVLPLIFAFFLHTKLIYFIRSRHNQLYLTRTAYILSVKRHTTAESQEKRRSNKENMITEKPETPTKKTLPNRRFITINTETAGSRTTSTTTTAALQSPGSNSNPNNLSNSSQSSRSSTAASSSSITSPIVLYKINSQANANANRTVLLLVLLLSFYVFCWAPHNIYTWHRAYQFRQSSLLNRTINNNNTNPTPTIAAVNNLRRFIFINYFLYLLSMVSMCFSFIFYFALNKQARQEFVHLMGCICPWRYSVTNRLERPKSIEQKPNGSRQFQYRTRYQNRYPYKNERIKLSRPLIHYERYNHIKQINHPNHDMPKRIVLQYGCQVKCCP